MSDCQSLAFILAKHPLSEYKALWEFFTEAYGRLTLVVPLSRRYRPLEIGQQVIVAWREGSFLATVRFLEIGRCFGVFSAKTALSIFYLNELIRYFLPTQEPYPRIFEAYSKTVAACIAEPGACVWLLRWFEFTLLENIGYAFPLTTTQDGYPIVSKEYYHWYVPDGARLAFQQDAQSFPGSVLFYLRRWRTEENFLYEEKYDPYIRILLHETLNYYLSGKKIEAKQLWKLLVEDGDR